MNLKAMDAHRRAIRLWLYVVAALVVLIVMVGGATRLTDSGLSIVEWRPIAGTVPPLNEADWIMELEKYKTSSEYELVRLRRSHRNAPNARPRESGSIRRA